MRNPKTKIYTSLLEIAIRLQIKNFLLKRQLPDHALINHLLIQPKDSPTMCEKRMELIHDFDRATSFPKYGILTQLNSVEVNAALRVTLNFSLEHQIEQLTIRLDGSYSNHTWRWDKQSLDEFVQKVSWPMIESVHDQLLSHLAD